MESKIALSGFAALAQETRLEVLRALVRKGPAGLPAGDIARAVGAPAPTLSFHLKELAAAGLVRSRKEGRSVIYAADYGGIRALVDFVMENCCQGDPRLCGPYIVNKEKCDETPACALQG